MRQPCLFVPEADSTVRTDRSCASDCPKALHTPLGKNVRRFLADTCAMVVFSIAVGAFVELVITGLIVTQTIRIRAAAVPVSLLVGRPYGMYRDWIFRRLGTSDKTPLKAILLDTFVNVTFQIPLYALILAFNGATLVQIVTAVGSILVIAGLSGRPYGIF
ncbi:L-alanine exporter AlaE [Burkholderia multivorans]|uniref:L-alanine exporter AlaE n=1 Tax=Burkholderia multivorans TaxID=87883 RepID=A0AB37APF6_9BURK|nr:L-alanine exporter AlaE [Burkholderia multivorans]PRE45474.1 L-alanine exporter AlaE [Burkholderia multivorans]PRE52162.1 L-alanine exporter AlaE [Burkholderia multivorans]